MALRSGSCRRVSEVLLVCDELDQDHLQDLERAAATAQPPTPRRGQRICLTDASIVAPDGKCLATRLSFSVESDGASNLLITGANGVGSKIVMVSRFACCPSR